MSALSILAWVCAVCAAIPAWTFVRNLVRFSSPPRPRHALAPVSVLIPARNEESGIGEAVRAALRSLGVELEVVVGDDGSTDRTCEIVAALSFEDPRVRLESVPPLPAGWCGKQHACAYLAERARHDLILFLDADVRLEPDAIARTVGFLESTSSALVSGFPRQVTVTWMERLLLPLMHFVLLGFLPMGRMRRSTHPSYGAGCGQLIAVRRAPYRRAGGHGAIRASLHDGVQLPRALRRVGERTDLFDASEIAACRMYHDAREVWSGLGKNATEGLAAPGTIGPASLLLLLGQVLPLPLLVHSLVWGAESVLPAALATGLSWLPRILGAIRFGQAWDSVLLHPLGVVALLTVQWQAFARRLLGLSASWKGRAYGPHASSAKPASTATTP